MSETETQASRGLMSFLRRDRSNKKKKSWKREVLEWVVTAVVALLIAFVVRSFIFEPVKVDGDSMYPTLRDGEIMYVSKTDYGTGFFGIPFTNIGWRFDVGEEPERLDVVVCYYPDENKNVVKRLVGLPGDTVELRLDPSVTRKDKGSNLYHDATSVCNLYINGELIDEDFIYHEAREAFGPFIVPKKGDLVNPRTRSAYSQEELDTLTIVIDKTTYTDLDGNALDPNALPLASILCVYDEENVLRRAYDGRIITDAEKSGASIVIRHPAYTDRNGNPLALADIPANAVLATVCEEDQYFLLGDNRTNSLDSRTKRTVGRGNIVGKVESVIWRTIPNDLTDTFQYNMK